MDYEQEWQDEIAVLESIFTGVGELQIQDKDVAIAVQPSEPSESNPIQLTLHITRTPTYPDEAPILRIEQTEGDLDDKDLKSLEANLLEESEGSLGMGQIFNLSSILSEALTESIKQKSLKADQLQAEEERKAEEAEAARTRGTPVTAENFAKWKASFMKEMQREKQKSLEESQASLSTKERDVERKVTQRLTGKQLFERNSGLESSDADYEGEEMDLSKFSREDEQNEAEKEERGMVDFNSDSD